MRPVLLRAPGRRPAAPGRRPARAGPQARPRRRPARAGPVEATEVTKVAEASDIRALSGKPVPSLTLDAIRAGEIGVADLRIHPDTLERQAVVANKHGNPQLAQNLRRAAELTRLPDDEVLAIYEALRPGRSSVAALVRRVERRGRMPG